MMRVLPILLVSICALVGRPATAAESTAAQIEFFEQRIRPMLANECYECHGIKKQKGGLRVDFREGLIKGGDSGPAIVPGDAKKSLLIQSIRHDDPDSAMPKDRPKLSDAVIRDFVSWVNAGAADPRSHPPKDGEVGRASWEATFAARRDWWSFKPVRKPAVPAVRNQGWSPHPVDQFLLAKMEERNLAPASPADRRTLIRRLAVALTGLPPAPEEVRAFVDDAAPDAYGRLVARLLDSPRFGEHWARHWMDLVRFAETHGSEGDPELPNAWRYRDYLIRAFNADVPWNRLIQEHLAGDLLPDPRWNKADGFNESLLGVAHLRLVEHGFNPVDTLDEQIKTVDSQIDVVSKAFQALTTSCARCHDHKFDPISERDYYALHGIFASVRPAQVSIDAPNRLRVHREELTTLKRSIRERMASAWENAARELPRKLLDQAAGGEIPGDQVHTQIVSIERQISDIDAAGRAAVLRRRGNSAMGLNATNVGDVSTMPMAAWMFDGDARDALGDLHGELEGGATIRNGRLVLDGKSSFVRTTPLKRPLREKTLEAWVSPANLEQAGGGVLTVESIDGSVFDSIVFAEKEPRKWTVGSDFYRRSRNLKGPDETAKAGELVHVAIVYRTNDNIALFRNGVSYGAAYSPSGAETSLRTFAANSARVLLGMRHSGGGNPFFAGEVEEARLYDRALSPKEVKGSFNAGPGLVTAPAIAQALAPPQRVERERLIAERARLRAELKEKFPGYAERRNALSRMKSSIDAAAANPAHPLHLWSQLHDKSGSNFNSGWRKIAQDHVAELAARRRFNQESFTPAWDFRTDEVDQWFRHGMNPPEVRARPGEFSIEPDGKQVFKGLLPGGVLSHQLSQKHNAVFVSPRFKITNDSISIRVVGGKGAGVRLILDNYPLGQGSIYPAADFNSDAPTWVRLDVAYRKGGMAYLEFATRDELTSRNRGSAGPGGRSFFAVERVVFHDGKAMPREEATPNSLLLKSSPSSAEELANVIGGRLIESIAAWQKGSLNEEQHAFLDAFLRAGFLPSAIDEVPGVSTSVAEYRRLEATIPEPRRAPGVLETVAYNAPLLSRGDHLKPLDPVPRGYLQLVSQRPYETRRSGRLELADDITSPANPLTARVMVNRIWHHLFGRGLVATVDNFGRLGEKPTHPELLDFLAARFVEQGWSAKELIRYLVTTRAYQMSSEASARAREMDPDNQFLSHTRTRRMGAESIRDGLLAMSGRLDPTMFGPGVNALAPPAEQRRRSVYLMVRRNFPSPFLETFDAPKPFSTLGRRETTNVPAQSLALLNDPFVIEQAAQWAQKVLRDHEKEAARVGAMFEMAFARPPDDTELSFSRAYLADLAREHKEAGDPLVWRDFAQSLFNLKEFIYVR